MLVWLICQPPEPPTITLKLSRYGLALIAREHLARVVRVDRLLRRAEDRGVDAGGERHAERIVRGDRDDARVRADELVEVVRVAADDVVGADSARSSDGFEHADAGRHVARRAVVVVFDVAPLRILPVENALEPHRQRGHAHLNEVPGVVDDLGERRRQHDELPAVQCAALRPDKKRSKRIEAVQPGCCGQRVSKTITNGWVGKRAPVSGPIRGFKGLDLDFSATDGPRGADRRRNLFARKRLRRRPETIPPCELIYTRMRVLKFGGSSLATPARIRDVGRIVLDKQRSEPVIVVVSAFQGVTNQLLECARLAERGDADVRAAAAGHRAAPPLGGGAAGPGAGRRAVAGQRRRRGSPSCATRCTASTCCAIARCRRST